MSLQNLQTKPKVKLAKRAKMKRVGMSTAAELVRMQLEGRVGEKKVLTNRS